VCTVVHRNDVFSAIKGVCNVEDEVSLITLLQDRRVAVLNGWVEDIFEVVILECVELKCLNEQIRYRLICRTIYLHSAHNHQAYRVVVQVCDQDLGVYKVPQEHVLKH
jgi:hypothetical protein